MTSLLRAAALAAALGLAATPAYAQNVNTSAQGTFGNVRLNAGFTPDPYVVSVTAGGPIDASRLGESCVGMIPQRASFTLNYRAGTEWPLYISAVSDGDTVLAVRSPDGQWSCNDDTNGLNPAVHYAQPRAGRYQIYVGTFGGADAVPAILQISEVGAGTGTGTSAGGLPDWQLDPAYGVVELAAGFADDPHTQDILAGGELDASALGVQGCVGHIARAPDYRVMWSGNSGLPLIFSVNSEADTTLVINDPSDNWVCDDDGGNAGLNPSVTFASPQEGQYDIWVGTYGEGGLQQSTLHVSELTSQ